GDDFREGFGPLLPGTVAIPFGNLDVLAAELAVGDVAAFVLEPIQGKSVEVATPEYLAAARDLCHEAEALLVVDEVQSGLGRTGRLFCYQHTDVIPDIVTMAKALSGGFVPVGATLCSDETWRATYKSVDRALVHSSTFGQNTLAMVAGLATLAVLDDEDLIGNAERTGKLFTDAIRSLGEHHDVIADVRGRGLMIGIEFGSPAGRLDRSKWKALEAVRSGLFSQLVVGPLFNDHRILTQVAADDVNVVKLLPPLVAGQAEVDRLVTALDDVLGQAIHIGASTVRLGRDFASRGLKSGALRR
ncbi:MAG TPA: aminotransferase class III-fold pyridoxal phosphate-dependent enzyme, partial [Acidimicrobiales bacterium]